MAYIRKVKTKSGAIAVQIAHKEKGQIIKLNHLGSAHTDKQLQALLVLAKKQLLGRQKSLFSEKETGFQSPLPIRLKSSFSGLLLKILAKQYDQLGLNILDDQDFQYLCLARLVEPTSKLDSLRVLADLGVTNLSKDQLYRCLRRVVEKDYRTRVAESCLNYTTKSGITLILYDVTTLYFEITQEDTYRKSGLSKERRLEPQIIIGLLVDQSGFPLDLTSFEGNKAETATILPVMEQFKKKHGLINLTVVADAAMLSAGNLKALTEAGYQFIVGSRLQKIPYCLTDYQKAGGLKDGQIITTERTDGSRIIYQYKEKRAALDKRNIQKQIAKAERIVKGQSSAKRARFLSFQAKQKHLNQDLIAKAYALIGIKGYVTNLDQPDEKVINYYHQLFNVEASFRMAKSDLKARPIFHHKKDSIEAHLTIVFTALAIARSIERDSEISIKQFVKTLRPIRSGVIVINGQEYEAEAEIPPSIEILLKKLNSGH